MAGLFVDEHVGAKRKAYTAKGYDAILRRYFLPALGKRKAELVIAAVIVKLHLALRDRPYQAYRLLAIIGSMYSFAAQRGLFKDEVAGLFGAFNRRDYMTGMKDLIMELYDCPDYSDKDTQTGLTIVKDAALSILGVSPSLFGGLAAWSELSIALLGFYAAGAIFINSYFGRTLLPLGKPLGLIRKGPAK